MAEALSVFEDSLGEASTLMPGWRDEAILEEWSRCNEALDQSLLMCARLREEAPELGGFEGLVGLIGELIGAL